MRYVSTRGSVAPVSASAALRQGLAPDSGLFVPETWPHFTDRQAPGALPDLASRLLAPFFAGDPLAPSLAEIAADAFNFPAPLAALDDKTRVLELFHGPTAAFKDFGARFLAACQHRLPREDDRELHILVATSGDTGGAVAAAFHNRPGVSVSILYPAGMVSPAQERQLTCWGGNVRAFRVAGAFDDCQRLAKEAFADADISARFALSSANSINIARLLPQMTYFAAASITIWNETRAPASFVIPSGNLGHATACVWARRIGLPIGRIVLAHNANRTMPDYLASGEWRPRPTIATLASAMDVGDPSNGERLRHLFPALDDLRRAVAAYVIEDEAISERIRAGFFDQGAIWCPHTAAGVEALQRVGDRGEGVWVVVATAHPAKFAHIVQPLIGQGVKNPAALEALPPPAPPTDIEANLAALRRAL